MKKQLALFDFDGTMIKGDSIAALVRAQFWHGFIKLPGLLKIMWMFLLWKLGKLPVETVKSSSLAGLKGLTSEQAEAFLKDFASSALHPRIYPKALEALKRHKAQGHLVLLVSASPLCYLQHLQDLLPADHIIATISDEHYKVITNVVKDEKNRQILYWVQENQLDIDWAGSFAYGDSANDLPMLGMVGNPTLVNPHMKARRMAKKRKIRCAIDHWA